MNHTTVAIRAELLLDSDSPSAKSCAKDALVASSNAQTGVHYPISCLSGTDAELWMKTAACWIERGASHAWGYERPAGW